jgi:hypothetical protein
VTRAGTPRQVLPPSLLPSEAEAAAAGAAGQLFALQPPPPPVELVPKEPAPQTQAGGLPLTLRFEGRKLSLELPAGATGTQVATGSPPRTAHCAPPREARGTDPARRRQLRAAVRRGEWAVPMEAQEFVCKGRRLRADGAALADEGVAPGATLLLKRRFAAAPALRSVAAGVLSYDAAEGTCALPKTLADALGVKVGDMVRRQRRRGRRGRAAASVAVKAGSLPACAARRWRLGAC